MAIGDIHGCAQSLEGLLNKLGPWHGSLFLFIGDYIDRGPDSRGVFDLLLDFAEKQECVFLRGNHEAMMLEALDDGDDFMWKYNGGRTTIDSFGMKWPKDFHGSVYDRFIRDTLFYYETEEFFFTHGGLMPHKTIKENLETVSYDTFLWERNHISFADPNWEKPVVFGHTPVEKPINEPLKIGIDTGCVYPGRPGMGILTAVVLPERKFIQQSYLDH